MTSVWAFDGIGTHWQIDSAVPVDASARTAILDAVESFDRTWSRFRPDSLVTAMRAARTGGTFTIPADDAPLLDLYDRLHDLTSGAVDPLVGSDLEAIGYDADYSLRPTAQAPHGTWRHEVRRDGIDITTRSGVLIDVGAAGKGFLVDRVATILRSTGHDDFVVDGSGDLLQAGPLPLRVGLEHPWHADRVVGVAELRGSAICASATNRRAWGRGLHHVLDGRTGRPTSDVVATWAISSTAAEADGYATALFFDRLPGVPGLEWARVRSDGGLEATPGFPGELFA